MHAEQTFPQEQDRPDECVSLGKMETLPSPRQWATIKSIAKWASEAGLKGTSRPGTAAMKILLGLEHGITPGVSLQEVQLVDQRLSMSAVLQAALIHNSPTHHIKILEITDTRSHISAWRSDDPDHVHDFILTYDQAVERGYTKGQGGKDKPAWHHSRTNMLTHRNITTIAKLLFQDLIIGVGYTPDELGADVDEDGRAIEQDDGPPQRDNGFTINTRPGSKPDTTTEEPQYPLIARALHKVADETIADMKVEEKAVTAATAGQDFPTEGITKTSAPGKDQPEPEPAHETSQEKKETPIEGITSATQTPTPTLEGPIPPATLREIEPLVLRLQDAKVIPHQQDWQTFLSKHFHGPTAVGDLNATQGRVLVKFLTVITKIIAEPPPPPGTDKPSLMPDTPQGLATMDLPELRGLHDAILKNNTPFEKGLKETGN